jgi:hypothetical protein
MLKEAPGRGDGAGEMAPDAGSPDRASRGGASRPAGSTAARLRGLRAGLDGAVTWLMTGLPALIRRNLTFSIALVLGVIPRVITMLGFRPAVVFKLDSFDYLWDAAHLQPNPVNPNGYSLFLWVLRPFHSLALIAAVQHVLGLTAAVLVYAVLRKLGVRAWIATLGSATILFDPAQFMFESLVMADLLAMVLMIMAFAVLLLRDEPSVPRVVTAGLLMGGSVTVRPTTLPLIVFMAIFLLVRRAGWLRALTVLVAGVLPLVAYMSWFASVYGSFNLTNSNGLFLWSRTMTFANCSVIKPAPDLRALCPENQPRQQALPPGSGRLLPKIYLWDHTAWMWTDAAGQKGVVPDVQAFTKANNDRALRFAIAAIKAQPLGFAHAIGLDVATIFTSKDVFRFPVHQPLAKHLGPVNRRYAEASVQAYTGGSAGLGPYLGPHFGTRLHQPFARMIGFYQRLVFLPGPLFALIVAVGLGGLFLPRRRSWAAALLWLSAVVTVMLPIAEHEYTYRYVVPAVPLACMAVALIFASRRAPAVAGPAAPDPDQDTSEARSPENADTAPAAS